ncbi:MAG: hypothetical protein ACQEUT_04625 [Bacillota bacterium]
MNKQNTKAFAAGLLLSSIVLIIFSFYNQDETNSIKTLEEQGYTILTEEEEKNAAEELASLQEQVETLNKSRESGEQHLVTSEDTRSEITLTVSSGMTPMEIGRKLEDEGIIKNSSDLNSYLVKSGLADKIQIGDYQLHSEMTLEEISTILTK